MKRKRNINKNSVYAALDFATKMTEKMPCASDDLDALIRTFGKMQQNGKNVPEREILSHIPFTLYTCADWLKYKQAYRITQTLADDLFEMEDLNFPLDALHLPFPTIFLDFTGIKYNPGASSAGKTLIGVYITLDDVPYQGKTASMCSIAILWRPCILEKLTDQSFPYAYGGISFDFFPEHMDATLGETIHKLTYEIPEGRKVIRDSLLFLAYLSSDKPDITEEDEVITETEKLHPVQRFHKKSDRNSVKKWDVGIRYMKEKASVMQAKDHDNNEPFSAGGRRPHIRKAHWHTYWTGSGRKNKKVLWLAPITVGIKGTIPVVIRKKEKEDYAK